MRPNEAVELKLQLQREGRLAAQLDDSTYGTSVCNRTLRLRHGMSRGNLSSLCLSANIYKLRVCRFYPSPPANCETPFGDSVLPRQWNSFSSFTALIVCFSDRDHIQFIFKELDRAQAEIHEAKNVVKFQN